MSSSGFVVWFCRQDKNLGKVIPYGVYDIANNQGWVSVGIGLKLHVRHFPPGTSKWNKIEHRLFCHFTQNWRGKPLVSHEVIVNPIANTTTRAGLKVKAALDKNSYETGIKVADVELAKLKLKPAKFHGDWNYSITPHT